MYKHNLKFSFSNVFYLETFRKRTSRVCVYPQTESK